MLMSEKTKEVDTETHFKDTFRVFSKDEEGLLKKYTKYVYYTCVVIIMHKIRDDGIWKLFLVT